MQKSFLASGECCPPQSLRLVSERDVKSGGVVLNPACTLVFSSVLWWGVGRTPRRCCLCSLFPRLERGSHTRALYTSAHTQVCFAHTFNSSSAFDQLEQSGAPLVPPLPIVAVIHLLPVSHPVSCLAASAAPLRQISDTGWSRRFPSFHFG